MGGITPSRLVSPEHAGIAAGSAISFGVLRKLVVPWLFPAASKNKRVMLAILSFIHASITAAYSFYHVVWRPLHESDDPNNKATKKKRDEIAGLRLIAFMCGYFANDTWSVRHDLFTHTSDVIHHVLAFVISGSELIMKLLPNFIPPVALIEISTIFLDILKVFRELGLDRSTRTSHQLVFKVSKISFVTCFFFLRVVWFPWLLYLLETKHHKEFKKLGVVRHLVYAIWLLQLYWFFKIVRILMTGKM